MSVRLPTLHDIQFWDVIGPAVVSESVLKERGIEPHDFVRIQQSSSLSENAYGVDHFASVTYTRACRINDMASRRTELTILIEDTVLLDDALPHFAPVISQVHSWRHLQNSEQFRISLRPDDQYVKRMYGELDPRWHAVHLVLSMQNFMASELIKGAELQMVNGHSERYELTRLSTIRNTSVFLPNLLRLRCEEHNSWQPKRSIIIKAARNTEDKVARAEKLVLTQLCDMYTSKRSYLVGLSAYEIAEKDALFLIDMLKNIVSQHPAPFHLVTISKPGYVCHVDTLREVSERRVCTSLAYLRWQCCSTALALCKTGLPVYCVLWIVQFMPAMYKLEDHELVPLIEGVYRSVCRIANNKEQE